VVKQRKRGSTNGMILPLKKEEYDFNFIIFLFKIRISFMSLAKRI